jgi:hypothetical protein
VVLLDALLFLVVVAAIVFTISLVAGAFRNRGDNRQRDVVRLSKRVEAQNRAISKIDRLARQQFSLNTSDPLAVQIMDEVDILIRELERKGLT